MQFKTLTQPRRLFTNLLMECNGMFPTKLYLKLLFRLKMGYRLNLKNPKTFSEKLQWLKICNRRPEYKQMVDKAAVKDYVAKIIGKEYIIPTLGVWERPEDIEWDKLPNQFVLKTTHGGGSEGVVICKNKTTFDTGRATVKLNKAMKQDIWGKLREWPYKDMHKRIIAEQYLESKPTTDILPDFKWYCFDGEPTFCQVIQDRNTNETIDFFDIEWNHQEFYGLNPAAEMPLKPANLEVQIRIARELAKGIPFVRIDLYQIADKTYFGEETFYPMSGMGCFQPEQYNEILGKMLTLPGEKLGGAILRLSDDNELIVEHLGLDDYKFYCFNGEVKYCEVISGRFTNKQIDFFDLDWNHQEFTFNGYDYADVRPIKPSCFDEMVKVCSQLCKDKPYSRIDLYVVGNKVYFGEITFFPASGFRGFHPVEWNIRLGDNIQLPASR